MSSQVSHHGSTSFCAHFPQLHIQLLELLAQTLTFGLPAHHKAAFTTAAHVMGKAKKIEGPRTSHSTSPQGRTAKAQQRRLTGFDLQVKRRQSITHFPMELLGIPFVLETRDVIIGKADQIRLAATLLGKAFLKPHIQHVVKVDVRQHWRNQSALWSPLGRGVEYTIFHHAGLEKAPDNPQELGIGDPVFQEPHKMGMTDMIKEAFDVRLNHPLGLLIGDHLRHPSQRIMRTAARAKSIRAITEFRFPDGLQDQTEPILYQAILKARNT
jgi:hypothetical protein